MEAIVLREHGGPDVLRLEQLDVPEPGRGQARVKVAASGVNYFDIRQRTGDFKTALPVVLGNEGAGTVDAIGPGVSDVHVGDRVGWEMEQGSYATHALIAAERLVPLPPAVDTRLGAAVLMQGLTAHSLATTVYPIAAGGTVLVHGVAGGVGGFLCEIAHLRGGRVIGTVTRADKAAAARAIGADEVIVRADEDFAAAAKRLTGGAGVDAVFDGMGRETFEQGFGALRPLGTMVLFGQASGAVPHLDTHVLQQGGGRYLTRAAVGNHTAVRAELLRRAAELFDWIAKGKLHVRVERTYPLGEAARAHEDLGSRHTAGKLLLEIA
ncbi:MAG TPA: quinone oxidoreductase [Candidatus Limnocylindria bacterium]